MGHHERHEARLMANPQTWRIGLWAFAGAVLLLPAVAMQFTSEVRWGGEDFLAAALLIGGTGLGAELSMRRLRTSTQRYLAIGAMILLGVAIWAELAVGIL